MRIVFMGTPEPAEPSLRRLVADGHEIVAVWTQPDRPAGRGKKLHASPVKQFALEHQLHIHQPENIKTSEAKGLFRSHDADVAVVVAYGRILPQEFLDAPRHGCINVHFSLLPKYRGAAPVNWAIVNGENDTGVTTMRIVQELDAGPILQQHEEQIGENETAPQLMSRLADVGADLISQTLQNLDRIEATPQLDADATFAPILKREDGLIDWTMDAYAIARRVRGFQPWPNAYSALGAQRLIVWNATPEWIEQLRFTPGQVIDAVRDRLIVACGDGTALRLDEVQLQGSRRMRARDFLNGTRLQVGDVLGQES
jgi:methionyl-tRNA formyltransferase